MQSRRHVKRLEVVVGALDGEETRAGVGAHHSEKIGQAHTAEIADHIPALYTNVAGVLGESRQSVNLPERVISWPPDRTCNRKIPFFEVNAGIVHIVTVNRELLERSKVRVRKSGRRVAGTEKLRRSPVAETKSGLKKW